MKTPPLTAAQIQQELDAGVAPARLAARARMSPESAEPLWAWVVPQVGVTTPYGTLAEMRRVLRALHGHRIPAPDAYVGAVSALGTSYRELSLLVDLETAYPTRTLDEARALARTIRSHTALIKRFAGAPTTPQAVARHILEEAPTLAARRGLARRPELQGDRTARGRLTHGTSDSRVLMALMPYAEADEATDWVRRMVRQNIPHARTALSLLAPGVTVSLPHADVEVLLHTSSATERVRVIAALSQVAPVMVSEAESRAEAEQLDADRRAHRRAAKRFRA